MEYFLLALLVLVASIEIVLLYLKVKALRKILKEKELEQFKLIKKLEEIKEFAELSYRVTGDTYYQGRRDLAQELVDVLENEVSE